MSTPIKNDTQIEYRRIIQQEYLKCFESPAYFCKKYCYIFKPVIGKIPFHLYKFQEEVLSDLLKYDYNIILKSRQLGISTLSAGYSLWDMIFHEGRSILVIATKQDVAKNLVEKVIVMFDNLPSWLKMGVLEKNKLSLKLSNGSNVRAISAAGDSGRSFACSTLIIDECVAGNTIVTLRNKITNEIFDEKIENLFTTEQLNEYKSTDITRFIYDYEVLTPTGYSNFTGIKRLEKEFYYKIKFDNNCELMCSDKHKIKLKNGLFEYAINIHIGDIMYDNQCVTNVIKVDDNIFLYDLLDVKNDNEYYTNGIISHNCAFIPGIDEIWTAAQPVLSNGGKCIILSTPNGIGGFFHREYTKAENNEGIFHSIKLKWDVHPERDDVWRESQTVILGAKMAAQECDGDFNSSGDTLIEMDILNFYKDTFIKDPVQTRDYYGGAMWIWGSPETGHRYMVSADCSRGDGKDYHAFHVLDIDTLEQCAEYKGVCGTTDFGNMLVAISTEYNDALLLIENASYGWAVIQQVINRSYRNLFYSSSDLKYVDTQNNYTNKIYAAEKKLVPGVTTSVGSRPLMVNKLGEYFRDRSIIIRSNRLLQELYVFVWLNGKAQARYGYNDDLVMSMCFALWVRDTSLKLMESRNEMDKSMIDAFKVVRPEDAIIYSTIEDNAQNQWTMDVNGTNEKLDWLL